VVADMAEDRRPITDGSTMHYTLLAANNYAGLFAVVPLKELCGPSAF